MQQLGERRIVIVPTRTSSGAATNVVTTLQSEFSKYTQAIFILNVTAQSGTTPTLDVFIQQECPIPAAGDLQLAVPSGVSVWNDWGHFKQFGAATGTEFIAAVSTGSAHGPTLDGTLTADSLISGPIPTSIRIKEILGGTTPSYTYTLSAILVP